MLISNSKAVKRPHLNASHIFIHSLHGYALSIYNFPFFKFDHLEVSGYIFF